MGHLGRAPRAWDDLSAASHYWRPSPSGPAHSGDSRRNPRLTTVARICLIRQGYYPLDPRARYEVAALAAAGHEVFVICQRRRDEAIRERHGSVRVYRVPMRKRRGGRFGYLIEYAAFFVAATLLTASLHFRHRFRVVQVSTMPDSLVFAAIVPRLLGARVLLDLYESMPEFYAVKFGVPLSHPVIRVLARLEQSAIRFANVAITCTEQMREGFEARGARPGKIDLVVNATDEEEFDPQRYPALPHSPNEFRLICHGSIERRYGIDTIMRAVALLRDEIPGLSLAVYGHGSAWGELRSLRSELGLEDRVHLHGLVPLDVLLQAIAAADVGVVAMQRDIFRDLTLCSKMFDYVAMRKPAIVSRTRAAEAYFGEAAFQWFSAGDDRDLARAIRQLHADPALRERLASQASEANEPHRWARQRERYLEIVQSLTVLPSPARAAQHQIPSPSGGGHGGGQR